MAADRKLLTRNDPVAEALDVCTQFLRAAIEEASDLDALLDVPTVARMLNMSQSNVRVLCAKGGTRGGLSAEKIGGDWRISRISVEARLQFHGRR